MDNHCFLVSSGVIRSVMYASICRNHRITEQVMVGTHGSLKNLYSKRVLKFQSVRVVVFDEADEMLKV